MFKSKVIKASAGTGKTFRLSLEYIGILLKMRRVSAEPVFKDILVVTFTRKATAEIRERIFNYLEILTDETHEGHNNLKSVLESFDGINCIINSDLQNLKDEYSKMLLNKHMVSIKTIDGFINFIFRNLVAPAKQIFDYVIDDNSEDEIYLEILNRILGKEEYFNSFEKIFLQFIQKGRSLDNYIDLIKSFILRRYVINEILRYGKKEKDELNYDDEIVDLLLGKFYDFLTEILGNEDDLKKILKSDIVKVFDIENLTPNKEEQIKKWKLRHCLDNSKCNMYNINDIAKKNFLKKNEKYEAELSVIVDLMHYFLLEKVQKEQSYLIDSAKYVYEIYDEIKMTGNSFSHNDLLFYSSELILDENNRFVAENEVTNLFYEYLAGKFRFCLIDEFQDTGISQWKIFLPVLREITGGKGKKDDGSFVIVGDDKQAIYGWRGGEKELLNCVEPFFRRFTDNIVAESLNTNYRSSGNVIEFVNKTFSSLNGISEKLAKNGIEWNYINVKPHSDDKQGYCKVLFDNYSDRNSNECKSKQEAFESFVNNVLLKSFEQGISPSSSVVLARTNKDLSKIGEILKEKNIPYVFESVGSILGHRLVKPFFYLLKWFNFGNITDLLFFFRSEGFGISNSDFFKITELYRGYGREKKAKPADRRILSYIIDSDVEFDCDLKDFFSRIASLNLNVRMKELVISVFRILDFEKKFNISSDYKNLFKFIGIAHDFDESKEPGSRNIRNFLRYLVKNKDAEFMKPDGLQCSDKLQLMSVHKSKGLEFKTVFLFLNFGSYYGNSSVLAFEALTEYKDYFTMLDSALLIRSSHLTKLKKINASNIENIKLIKDMTELKYKKELIGEVNNLYVALTRAKTNLIVYNLVNSKDGAEKVASKSDIYQTSKYLFKVYWDTFAEDLRENCFEKGEIIPEKEEEPVAEKEEIYSGFEELFNPESSLKCSEEDVENVYAAEAKAGELVHDFMQMIYYFKPPEIEAAERYILKKYGSWFSAETIKKIIETVLMQAEKYTEVFSEDWDHIFTEYILFDKDKKECRIDRFSVNFKDKKILIVDYKTGSVYDESQLDHYKKIISEMNMYKHFPKENIKAFFLRFNLKDIEF
ncbi:MAG: hypothetical protein CSB55_04755 [Candidatus Cloacimonadota bacterium]|nr:MAG: hypothetical protein CSB55_04755 [Candidatus Cloacimonadota bacterium]